MALIRKIKLDHGTAEYELVKTGRQNVLLKALPHGKTRVYAPTWMSLRELDNAVRRHWPQLQQAHTALDEELALLNRQHPLQNGSMLRVLGRQVTVRTQPVKAAALQQQCLLVPEHLEGDSARKAVRMCLSKCALEYIRNRIDHYAPLLGCTPGRVTVRDQNTRWGSCSSKGNLNFNWKLTLAPTEALDYVVVHELCHLLEFSHSPRFWKLVESCFPDYEIWKKWLKDHGKELYV